MISKDIGINNPSFGLDNSILILDGLDELYMKGNLKLPQVDDLCREFLKYAEAGNLRILVTSRYGYIDLDKLKKRDAVILQLKEFDLGQQKQWLTRYKNFHPNTQFTDAMIESFNSNAKYKHIRELIVYPILFYMILTSGVVPDKETNRAKIYDQLFSSLIRRQYEKDQPELLIDIEEADLRDFIRDIALATFHTGRGYIHKSEMLKHPSTQEFIKKLGESQARNSLKGIMIAFYFTEIRKQEGDESTDDKSDYAVEFVHKSLYEYMVAEKIWHEMKAFEEYSEKRREFIINRFSSAMEHAFKLFSPQLLTLEMVEYLQEIVTNDLKTDKQMLSERLTHFFPAFLEKDFFYSYDSKDRDFPVNGSIHCFYGYWTILSMVKEEKNYIPEYLKHRFAWFLVSLSNLYRGSIRFNLSHQDLSQTLLMSVALRFSTMQNIKLAHANLKGANLFNANILRGNLENANLKGANLIGANLNYANLVGTNLKSANLDEIELNYANLEKAKFKGAILRKAHVESANLKGATFKGAELVKADFKGAIMDKEGYDLAKAAGADVTNVIVEKQ